MFSEQATQSFLSIVTLVGFFVILIVQKTSSKIGNGILLDQDFDKPQAFHTEPIPRSGGLASFISLMFFIFIYNLLFGRILNDYLFLSIIFFSLGFLEDIKIKTNPNIRLIFMIIALTLSIIFLSINIDNIDIGFLKLWTSNRFFEVSFILLCFLFVINGANLIDGFNGLLAINLIIINSVLLFINLNNNQFEFSFFLTAQIIILISFLLFNFPKAKMFLGDSGSNMLGFAVAFICIEYSQNINHSSYINPVTTLWLVAIPLVDCVTVLTSRILKGIMPFRPGRDHLHHKLLNLGIKPKQILVMFITLSVFLAGIGYSIEKFYPNKEYISFYLFLMISIFYYLISKDKLNANV